MIRGPSRRRSLGPVVARALVLAIDHGQRCAAGQRRDRVDQAVDVGGGCREARARANTAGHLASVTADDGRAVLVDLFV